MRISIIPKNTGPLLIATVALVFAAPVLAATQGVPGPTSTGTATINASITPEVAISNLNDITFPTTQMRSALNTRVDAVQADSVCVWSNNVDRSFYVTASGTGAGNALTLTDGTRTLPYIVDFGTGNVTFRLANGVKSGLFRSPATAPDCGGLAPSNLRIQINAADIATMEATTVYTGVLTLLVTPN